MPSAVQCDAVTLNEPDHGADSNKRTGFPVSIRQMTQPHIRSADINVVAPWLCFVVASCCGSLWLLPVVRRGS